MVRLNESYISSEQLESVSTMKLIGCKIICIDAQTKFPNVKQLDLSENLLKKLDGVQMFNNLTELWVENNFLTDIEDVSHLNKLKKLELGGNQLWDLGLSLTGLKDLALLSLENNNIKTLNSLSELSNLLELYIGENNIRDLKEIKKLSTLKKLIVLELWGNPLCKEFDYRLYSIFNIKDIKVLDGISIQLEEYEESKETFTGRLSDELLISKLKGQNLETLLSMDLSSCNLRDFDNIFVAEKFPKIQEINLSNNFFTNFRCFGNLPHIRILIIASNRLNSFEPITDPKYKVGLNGMMNLEMFDISKNSYTTLESLKYFKLPRLFVLKAGNNNIRKVQGISHLTQLRDLDISSNRIKSLEAGSFDPGMKLKYLCLDENFIKSFNNLYFLSRLQHLFIRYNKIIDYNDIEGVQALPNLKELEMSGNPISRKYGYRIVLLQRIPNLLFLDGMEVTTEEKEQLEGIAHNNGGRAPQKQVPSSQKPVKMSNITFEELLPSNYRRDNLS